MGGAQASNTLLDIRLGQLKHEGREITDKEQQDLLKTIQDRYTEQTSPYYAAARLWVDGIIDPRETRAVISRSIGIADCNPDIPRFNPGILQT
jgi:acetyl-CoA carboxylase carboxyltransferase component